MNNDKDNQEPELLPSDVLLFHPNGDIHTFELDNPASADDLIDTIDFELGNGGADWLGICKRNLQADKQGEVQTRVAVNLIARTPPEPPAELTEHEEHCGCYGDSVPHTADCANCDCDFGTYNQPPADAVDLPTNADAGAFINHYGIKTGERINYEAATRLMVDFAIMFAADYERKIGKELREIYFRTETNGKMSLGEYIKKLEAK
jgi:hypothetical protein